MSKLKALGSHIGMRLGLATLPAGHRSFIKEHLFFLLFAAIPGTFVNTFFFRQSGTVATAAIYNALACFGSALVMHFSSFVVIKKNPAFLMRVGVMLYNLFYLALIIGREQAAAYMPLYALGAAVAGGFYWQGYNLLMQSAASPEIVNHTVSLFGMGSAVISLVIPVLTGNLISHMQGMTGYTVVFFLAFVVSLYTLNLARRIPVSHQSTSHNLIKAYHYTFTHKSWLLVMLSETFRGMRETSFPLFLSLIFFRYVNNELLLGISTMCSGMAALLANDLTRRKIRADNRLRWVFRACLMITAGFLLLFLNNSGGLIFGLSVFYSFMIPFVANPSVGIMYNTLQRSRSDINFGQTMAIHELFLATGRVLGLMILLQLSHSETLYAWGFLLLNLTGFIAAWLLHQSSRLQASEAAEP
ncbi:MFS transporter [Oscillospiraceae bacterium HV4-5-C5C]|nr:MFS transporter [Oscillospiraceae bacterium HV4-5-C5C]